MSLRNLRHTDNKAQTIGPRGLTRDPVPRAAIYFCRGAKSQLCFLKRVLTLHDSTPFSLSFVFTCTTLMASPHDPIFEEKVYLAFKDIFSGRSAKLRGLKAVQPIVSQNKKRSGVSSLLKSSNHEFVCQSLCRLLNEQIFESEARARLRFAKNPRTAVPPAPMVSKPVVPGPVVPKSPASELAFLQAPNSEPGTCSKMINALSESSGDTLEELEPELDTPANYESRYPAETSQLQVSLPLRIQNLILSHMQAILELACFDFATEKMPEILESRKWRCPKAGELNLWVGEFNKRIASFKSNVNNPEGYEISKCFQIATHIRHYAVHRRHLSTTHLQSLVNNAEGLCKILGNGQALAQIESIWGYAQAQISELESLKGEIVLELESSLDDIAARRAELNLLEAASIAKAHDKLNGHHDVASDELEKILLDRQMVLMAAGKVENEKEGDEADELDDHLSEELQPPEAKVEQYQPPARGLLVLEQRINQSMSLAQKIYNTLNSLPTFLHAFQNSLLLLPYILFGIAAAYILAAGGMEHMWGVLWWGEW
ncbi:uncharacterized protein NECHADRAFT_85044 [Fusarium vanettenii 77-13-4]|uniref:Ubiquinol-cytochrome-c reductase cytochrome c1 n=1 Tax=Fusarium vanettenii (strain ATCC MYA-4622 / CBS 123669 / FGSC 9596 / NRRL 45880 / 77-13-4) TaxID=660122 RepID=C7YUU5_FUSV7|nr:uncharacterized protein NECHADRAFT_85044 [Fusarium vanettenii 77-13-4]EEU44867.1 hypothetical protein NECHADRAFT_85044 [Fusarium vanettenii 77-13-4]